MVLRVETALASAHLSRVEMRDPKNRDNADDPGRAAEAGPGLRVERVPAGHGRADLRAAQRHEPEVLRRRQRRRRGDTRSTTGRPTCAGTWWTARRPTSARRSCRRTSASTAPTCKGRRRSSRAGSAASRPPTARSEMRSASSTSRRRSGPTGKARMQAMIEAITAAMREDIETLPWMTPDDAPQGAGQARGVRHRARSATPSSGRTTPRSR